MSRQTGPAPFHFIVNGTLVGCEVPGPVGVWNRGSPVWVPRAGAAALARLAARWLWAGRPLVAARPDLHGWSSVAGWAKHAAQCTERRATYTSLAASGTWNSIPSVLRPDARCPLPAACSLSQISTLQFEIPLRRPSPNSHHHQTTQLADTSSTPFPSDVRRPPSAAPASLSTRSARPATVTAPPDRRIAGPRAATMKELLDTDRVNFLVWRFVVFTCSPPASFPLSLAAPSPQSAVLSPQSQTASRVSWHDAAWAQHQHQR